MKKEIEFLKPKGKKKLGFRGLFFGFKMTWTQKNPWSSLVFAVWLNALSLKIT